MSAKNFFQKPIVVQFKRIIVISGHFSDAGIKIDDEDILKIYNLFEGNTYCMQKTFHEAYDTLHSGEICTAGKLRAIIDSIMEEAGTGYRLMLSGIPTRQKELLYAIAEEGTAEKIMSEKFIRKYSLASSSAVQTAASKLKKMNLIAFRDGKYFIPDILLRLYLQKLMNADIDPRFHVGFCTFLPQARSAPNLLQVQARF